MAYLDETGLKHLWEKMLDKMYPVGSIYMSVNSTSPATIYGGTWEQIKGKFLLAEDGSTYKAGTEGGEASHKLTNNEMPAHYHQLIYSAGAGAQYVSKIDYLAISGGALRTGSSYNADNVEWCGGDAAHNNMPPYVAVYVWKRTA